MPYNSGISPKKPKEKNINYKKKSDESRGMRSNNIIQTRSPEQKIGK